MKKILIIAFLFMGVILVNGQAKPQISNLKPQTFCDPHILRGEDGSIDNDIIYHDGTYHLFYKGNTKDEHGKEVKNGIQQAFSKKKIAYSVADHTGGPYKPMGSISEIAGNLNTTHPAIVQFKNQWLFFSHNGGLPDGTSYSRSIIAEPLFYNADGNIKNTPLCRRNQSFHE